MRKKIKNLKSVEAAYIAAIIDGEGSVMLSRIHSNEYRQLVISISNCDKKMLEWIMKKIGLGKILPKKVYKKHYTPTFTYRIVAREALELLKQVTPYLLTYKKQRAEMVLKDLQRLTVRNGKYSPELLVEKRKFVEKFLNLNISRRNQSVSFI